MSFTHAGTNRETNLKNRVQGVVFGSACGDALGGPLEGLDHIVIARDAGPLDGLRPYTKPRSEHAQFTQEAGSVTDDTRLHFITIEAIASRGGHDVLAGDLALAIAEWREAHTAPLERAFIEEYHLAGLYGDAKAPWGGHATNGAIMSNHAVGVLHAADPYGAYRAAYDLAYISDGYGKEAAAMHASAVAAAFCEGASPESMVETALNVANHERRDGPLWRHTVQQHDWARFEGRPNHELVERALAIIKMYPYATKQKDRVRQELYEALYVSPVGSDAGQTLAVAFAMLIWTAGDPVATLVECVAYGRDNDSYASVAGALVGALYGRSSLPVEWIKRIESANPSLDFSGACDRLLGATLRRHALRKAACQAVERLNESV